MKVLALILFMVCDIVLKNLLGKYVFKDFSVGWQRLGALGYCIFVGALYFELMSGRGFIYFADEGETLFGFGFVTCLCLAMLYFHAHSYVTRLYDGQL
ncbi:hypothetical protein ACIP1G_02070 [Pseudomonas sp. NPDC089392]|uniref:hypothetical protein n=1 Tax=Pseudomonas sp. NPDC089392 TaxID=3364459 RepID=UPI0038163486